MAQEYSDASEWLNKSRNVTRLIREEKPHLDDTDLLTKLGEGAGQTKDYEHALAFYRESSEVRKKLLGDTQLGAEHAFNAYQIGNMHMRLKELKKAEPFYREALEIFKTKLPQNEESRSLLAVTHYNLELVGRNAGIENEEATLLHNMKALELYEEGVESNSLKGNTNKNIGMVKSPNASMTRHWYFTERHWEIYKMSDGMYPSQK